MSEQWTWEPLPDNADPIEIEIEYYVEAAGDDAVVYSAAYPAGTGLTMHDQVRTTISWSQHDDLRLCRRVPAQGVPVEVWHAIHEALEDYREDAQRNACPCADCTNERSAAEKALHWLHAQPQPAAPANLNLVCDGHVEADNE